MTDVFFQLLQVATGVRGKLDRIPTSSQWQCLFDTSREHALIGVCADAIDRLPDDQRPPKSIALQWALMAMRIERRNKYLNDKIVPICNKLNDDGFEVCLLKGQGVAAYYPNPLRRQSGDLDIWAVPKGQACSGRRMNLRRCRESVVEYAYRHSECTELGIHHIDFPVFKDIPIELHFLPAYFNNYITSSRLKRWLCKHAQAQFENITSSGVACPTDDFNLVFLLAHIYKHFLFEGIGLRQIMDYYYVVEQWAGEGRLLDDAAMKDLYHVLRRLGLTRFCGAVMWVLHQVFGMERGRMLSEPDAVLGSLLLERIMAGGNFGQYSAEKPCRYKQGDGHFMRYCKRVRNSMLMFRHAPMEIIWTPVRMAEIFLKIRLYRLRYRRDAQTVCPSQAV